MTVKLIRLINYVVNSLACYPEYRESLALTINNSRSFNKLRLQMTAEALAESERLTKLYIKCIELTKDIEIDLNEPLKDIDNE